MSIPGPTAVHVHDFPGPTLSHPYLITKGVRSHIPPNKPTQTASPVTVTRQRQQTLRTLKVQSPYIFTSTKTHNQFSLPPVDHKFHIPLSLSHSLTLNTYSGGKHSSTSFWLTVNPDNHPSRSSNSVIVVNDSSPFYVHHKYLHQPGIASHSKLDTELRVLVPVSPFFPCHDDPVWPLRSPPHTPLPHISRSRIQSFACQKEKCIFSVLNIKRKMMGPAGDKR